MQKKLIEHNYASKDYLRLPKIDKKKRFSLLNDEQSKQFAKVLYAEKNIRIQTALMIALFMGLRRGEIAGLEFGDIDFIKGTMKIQRTSCTVEGKGIITKDTKTTSSERELSIPATLLKQLMEYKIWWDKRQNLFKERWGDSDRLFISPKGKPIYPNSIGQWLKKILEKCGLPKVTLHSLRHTNLTMLLINGTDIKTVAGRAGHSDASVTLKNYAHFLATPDKVASQKLDEIFSVQEDDDFGYELKENFI